MIAGAKELDYVEIAAAKFSSHLSIAYLIKASSRKSETRENRKNIIYNLSKLNLGEQLSNPTLLCDS